MKYEELQHSIEVFDKFVNIGVSSGLANVNPIEVVRAYNKIRDFINTKAEFSKDE